jgi:monoamine oxidase
MYPVRSPIIVGWSGGPKAVALLQSERIEDIALSELANAFGMRRGRVEALVESIHTHDWTHDGCTRGAYSYVGVGGSDAAARLARPVRGTLFFAGEATDSENTGTVEGAIASGLRVCRQVVKAFG